MTRSPLRMVLCSLVVAGNCADARVRFVRGEGKGKGDDFQAEFVLAKAQKSPGKCRGF